MKVVTLAKTDGLENKTLQTRFESWSVCRSALPQVLLDYRLLLSSALRNGSNGLPWKMLIGCRKDIGSAMFSASLFAS